MKPYVCRTVWISDIHLGSRGCRAEELSLFLKHIRCDRLYLVGDIVDFWRIKGRPYWPRVHNEVLRRLLRFPKQNTEVIFVPGNHDDVAREYIGFDFGGVTIKHEDVHETADGRRFLITHGDEFDLVVRHARMVSLLGGKAYELLIGLNQFVNRWRRRFGMRRLTFSKSIKLRVKSACRYISAFEDALAEAASMRGFDGVVCGHIHQPQHASMRDIDYFNCGDWIESCSALVEHADGSMELVRFDYEAYEMRRPSGPASIIPCEPEAYRTHPARHSASKRFNPARDEATLFDWPAP